MSLPWIFLTLSIGLTFWNDFFLGLKLFKKFILSDNCFILFPLHVGSKMQYIIYARITGYGGNILFAAHGNREVAPTCWNLEASEEGGELDEGQ